MKTKMNEFIASTRELLANLITNETPKETIDKISEVSKSLDDIEQESTKMIQENTDLKDSYIAMVKNVSFKQDIKDNVVEDKELTLEEIISSQNKGD